jgi:tetratricopeptide (TPR) repeat protein
MLSGLGDVFLVTGQLSEARAKYTSALSVTTQTGEIYEQARARNGLAHVCLAVGDPGQARRHWEQALVIYLSLGSPEVDQIRARLARLARLAGTDGHA